MPRLTKRPTSPFIWVLAILCAALSVAVIVAGIVVFSVYMIYQPKMPYLKVPYAHLNRLEYGQSGDLAVEIAITVSAENDNSKADARFSHVGFQVGFSGVGFAELRADPFDVPRNSSVALNYVAAAGGIPLGAAEMAEMQASLREGKVGFEVEGRARTRWRVGVFLSVRFWTMLSCKLEFATLNGSTVGLDCSSKTL